MKIDQATAMFALECLRSDVREDRIEPYHMLTKAHYEAALLWAEYLIDKYEPTLDKVRAEIDRQEKWLMKQKNTLCSINIAFDSIRSVLREG